ncbi:MAG: Holliday junction resolvase RuvX [Chromatiaceae bacterium]|nr:Holliday junction resolvase RuvX [Gammaproteobacteria bacterium]MCP5313227.1 Holliday junction resolvase RuvX [Chromatiaceae bacterium]
MGVLLGFDYGTHKIGVAVGQALTGTATPLTTLGLVNHGPDWAAIADLLAEWHPEALVVGHPYEMSGREANNAAGAKRFARQLHGRFRLPVHLADERLTSRIAWTELGTAAAKDPTRVDAFAAKLILETWLND